MTALHLERYLFVWTQRKHLSGVLSLLQHAASTQNSHTDVMKLSHRQA